MTEIVLPRGSPCHIISLLSYQVQIKPAALAVNVVIEHTRNTLFMYHHHPAEGTCMVILQLWSTAE